VPGLGIFSYIASVVSPVGTKNGVVNNAGPVRFAMVGGMVPRPFVCEEAMRVLIQNYVSRRFLGDGDLWCESPRDARDFHSSEIAIPHYILHKFEDAQIVLHFDYDSRLDIELPLSKACQRQVAVSNAV